MAGVVIGRCGLGRVVSMSAAARVGLTVIVLSFLRASPPWAALALVALIGVAGTPCYPALMAGLRCTVAERQRERWGRRVVLFESVGTRWSLAALAITTARSLKERSSELPAT